MRHNRRFVVFASTFAILCLAGCARNPAPSRTEPAAKIEPIAGTDLHRLVISAAGARRIGLTTATVSQLAAGLAVPYSSVVYDPHGNAWNYVQADPGVFVREAISVNAINGSVAVLSHGPPVGAAIVSVGAAELYGLEFGGAE